ncbi:MAG: hypothetical protein OXI22_22995 [Defluviicoccus sp.]|nr:hypothetical protein [Defluviicoccus sp.]MDE0386767.1 hypothetical protein [Defluviicoccus sp.]
MVEPGRGAGAGGARRWLYQIRLELADRAAAAARSGEPDPDLEALDAILARHEAALVCQYDAFAFYCAEAERLGIALYPLYAWTRATIEQPAKKAKYLRSFSLRVAGEEVYGLERADALEAALRPLAGGPAVRRIARHDTNPANNPQPPERYRP